jgi:16S rRNA (guanine527-N7)-methyltransferase
MAKLVPPGASLIDVGSGGGLPALPFALVRPDVGVTLLEPRAKRVAFLRTAARELHAGRVTVQRGRLEDLADGVFGWACSRATLPPPQWLAAGRRLVAPAGRVLLFAAGPPAVDGVLEGEVWYETGQGRRRWLGAYRSS